MDHTAQHTLDLPDLHRQLPLPVADAGEPASGAASGRPPDPGDDGPEITSYADSSSEQQRRRAAAVAALAPSTRRAYAGAWDAWSRWAHHHGRRELPARPVDVADYFEHRHAAGAAPATVRMARAAIAKAHQVEHAPDPTADALVRHTLHRIGREGRHRGRGQAAPLSWAAAEAAASIAAATGTLAGLRDAALIRVGSDALLRVSELAALQVADIETHPDDGSGMLTVRSSKTDQTGRGELRYLGTPTVAAVTRWLQAAGIDAGALFRPLRPAPGGGHHAVPARLGPASVRAVIRRRAQAVDGIPGRVSGHSLRVGSAQSLAATGAALTDLQQAGGWRSPTTAALYVRAEWARRGPVARRRYGVGQ